MNEHNVQKRSEFVLLQISKGDLSTNDIERLMQYGQLQVDVVRRVGDRVCQANRNVLQEPSSWALVRCYNAWI